MKSVAIFGGSFNPVHIGHIIIASYAKECIGFDEVWMMLSPLNPLKQSAVDIIDQAERMEMLRLACREYEYLIPSDFELNMPLPSYTFQTLRKLSEEYKDIKFSIIVGGDNAARFGQWRNFEEIVNNHSVIVYPRPGEKVDLFSDKIELLEEAPGINLSATLIRTMIREKKDFKPYLNHDVYKYIKSKNLYLK